jgi:hypothetical protein
LWRQTGTGPGFFRIDRRLYTTVGELRRWIREQRLASRPLDQVLAWEEKRMALAQAAVDALAAAVREDLSVTDLLPQPERRRRAG